MILPSKTHKSSNQDSKDKNSIIEKTFPSKNEQRKTFHLPFLSSIFEVIASQKNPSKKRIIDIFSLGVLKNPLENLSKKQSESVFVNEGKTKTFPFSKKTAIYRNVLSVRFIFDNTGFHDTINEQKTLPLQLIIL